MSESRKLTSLADLKQLLGDNDQQPPPVGKKPSGHDGKGRSVRVRIETGGRKGKTVTVIEGLQHNPDTMEEIARALKQHCGAGGTVKQRLIEIQGDQRAKVAEKLRAMNYEVKMS